MASEASTCAFSDENSDNVGSGCSKCGKESTVIESNVTVITEKKKVEVSVVRRRDNKGGSLS